MSSDTNTCPCCFTWIIHPPFVPGQTMNAYFHHEAPAVAKWNVTLHFQKTRIGEWGLSLSLIFNARRDEREEIVVNNLETRIYLKRQLIVGRIVPGYIFNKGNRYRYYFQTSVPMFAQTEPHQLAVQIRIFLEEDSQIPSLPPRKDLTCLTQDLGSLAVTPRFHNVDLHAHGQIVFGAHSYILSVRWNNLFPWPPFHRTARTVVQTNISSYLLRNILIYMYSGIFIGGFPHWDNPPYITELFQVIERYDIHHLRDNLAKSDSSQLRVSKKSGVTQWFLFRLQFVDDRLMIDFPLETIEEYSATVAVRNQEYELRFQIHLQKTDGFGTWLSYSLLSRTDFWVYAQVNLEIVKMKLPGISKRREVESRIPTHAKTYRIGPYESEESEPVLFLGCLATFGDFPSMDHSGNVQQWFCFKLSLTDGTSLDLFDSFNKSRPSVHGKYSVLIDHMSLCCKAFIQICVSNPAAALLTMLRRFAMSTEQSWQLEYLDCMAC
ncbi:hypothetical protein AVEN_259302-1 [Araneus ventricosus]|uniref:BTB domain-containing protein n=1 Tax=Araneus ventricosus TaxID=182803 RepID=A0A4Y2GKT1_ARAVE|nr:hypothetical protein AVEN_259302-1 [Araneus ventricosus]